MAREGIYTRPARCHVTYHVHVAELKETAQVTEHMQYHHVSAALLRRQGLLVKPEHSTAEAAPRMTQLSCEREPHLNDQLQPLHFVNLKGF